ncbi:MAG: hypothetical protein WBF87_01640 [Mesorhizobium sp.]
MVDLGDTWPAAADWNTRRRPWDLEIREASGVFQAIVSGDLDAWKTSTGIDPSAEPSSTRDYAVRLARDRILAVTTQPVLIGAAWNAAGYAATDVTGGWLVIDFSGRNLSALVSRATTVPGLDHSPSAAMNFAGSRAIAYLLAEDLLRLHVDRSMSSHLWEWLTAIAPQNSASEPM